MKVSVKLEDQSPNQTTKNPPIPIHFNAKIPITVFGLPFLSGFSATHHHHSTTTTTDQLSLSLRTHFLSGPSLKLSYNTPTTTTTTTTTAPLTLTLKSGVSLSGSPNNSPLIISANFSFSPQNPNPNPSFLIQFKPKLGSFSLRKSVSSNDRNKKVNGGGGSENGNGNGNGNGNEYGFVPLDRPINWKDLRVESATKDSILSGILMAADTELPLTKRVKVNLRWGVGIPSDYEKQMPYLRVNKIKVERIDVNEEDGDRNVGNDGGSGEFEMFKGMYAWMNRELSDLQKENREMRRALDELKEMKSWKSLRTQNGHSGGGGKRAVPVPVPVPVVENSDGFEQWRMKRNAAGSEAHGQREAKKNGATTASDVESELQRAIKAAASSS